MLCGEFKWLAGVKPAVRADKIVHRQLIDHGRVYQHGVEIEFFGQHGSVKAAERRADQRYFCVIDPTAWRITTADFSMLLAILPTMLLNNLLRQRYRRRRR